MRFQYSVISVLIVAFFGFTKNDTLAAIKYDTFSVNKSPVTTISSSNHFIHTYPDPENVLEDDVVENEFDEAGSELYKNGATTILPSVKTFSVLTRYNTSTSLPLYLLYCNWKHHLA